MTDHHPGEIQGHHICLRIGFEDLKDHPKSMRDLTGSYLRSNLHNKPLLSKINKKPPFWTRVITNLF